MSLDDWLDARRQAREERGLERDLRPRAPSPDVVDLAGNDYLGLSRDPRVVEAAAAAARQWGAGAGASRLVTGTLELHVERTFPFVCYLDQDAEPGLSAGDVELGSSDFVVGYTSVFAYDELENHNPLLSGVVWHDLELRPGEPPARAGEPLDEPPLGLEDLCIGDACQPALPSDDPSVCPEALTLDACPDSGDCDEIDVAPVVDPASAETDAASSSLRSTTLLEQMWVNYYASDGKVSEEVRLLNDATEGWNSDPATKYEPGKEPAVAYLWSVAHDNRGGAEWARLRVCVR